MDQVTFPYSLTEDRWWLSRARIRPSSQADIRFRSGRYVKLKLAVNPSEESVLTMSPLAGKQGRNPIHGLSWLLLTSDPPITRTTTLPHLLCGGALFIVPVVVP
jgi:hypothetical protein